MESEAAPPLMNSFNLCHATPVNVTLVARLLLSPVAQAVCRCEHGVFILEHCFALKPSVTVHEAFSNECPEGEALTRQQY
jgi:hypothetical protein